MLNKKFTPEIPLHIKEVNVSDKIDFQNNEDILTIPS